MGIKNRDFLLTSIKIAANLTGNYQKIYRYQYKNSI